MDSLRQDVRYAIRRLLKSPGFTIVAVLTLALGIGANSAIFSVVNGVLLKPLPYTEPDRLVGLYHLFEGHRATMSGPNFTDVRKLSKTLADAAAIARSQVILTGQGEPVRLDGAEVSASLFNMLGVRPILGRTFNADENQPGHNKVAVLAYGLWQQRFGGDRRVLGRRITLDGMPIEVVGIMPKDFAYPAGRVIWTPLEYTEQFTTSQRGAWYLSAVGRVKTGIPIEQATAEIQTIGKQLAKQYPDMNEGLDFTAMSLHEAMVGDIRQAVFVLLGAVGFVLLIACTNVANLLLARAATRETEMAVRSALGAGRPRLVRQLLTESAILGAAGGALGLLLGIWGVDALISLEPQGIPRLSEIRIDTTVACFTLALSIATGLLFGLVPAFHSTSTSLSGALKEAGRGALTTRGGARMRGALVIAEMALAVMLLAGAGLLIRSFTKLASVDPGFHATQALTFELSLPDSRYEQQPQQVGFFDQLLPRLRAIPGVQSAGAAMSLPMSGSNFVLTFEVAGHPPVPPSQQPAMQIRVATPEYFQTIGIPLKRGRSFTEDDRPGSPPVVLITESAARQYFPNEDPIGKTVTLGWSRGKGTPRAGGEVVGIVGDVKEAGLDEAEPPQLYMPYRQWPVQSMSVVLKTAVPPATVADAARRAVYATDSNMPAANVRTLEQIVARSISQPRFYTTLLAIFAGLALVLAAIGIFGVLSYAVAQRTREIGIRMALGAQERTVLGLVVRQALLLAAAGVGIGVILALGLSRSLVSKMLFSTSPHDAATFVSVAALLGAVALVASYIPARRATRVDPIVALRAE
jgi:putative ABC transport system permease protein